MSSYNPPYPYFNGITYNKDYFETSGAGLSRTQANALYLQKTTPDTATALETFNTGIKTNTINAVSTSLDLVANSLGLNPNSASATTNIHTNSSSSSGTVNIMGSNGGSSGTVNICVGSGGGVTASECNISTGTTIGTVAIGNSANAVNVNSMALSLGTATKTLTVQAPITLNYNPSVLTGPSMIGYSVTSTFAAVSFASGPTTSTIIRSVQVASTGLYLITWEIQYAGGVVPIMFYSNIANTTTAVLKTPTIAVGNWGNSSLGQPNGAPFQSTHGSMVVQITANNYLNLLLFFNGTGTLLTDCGYLQYTRIA